MTAAQIALGLAGYGLIVIAICRFFYIAAQADDDRHDGFT